MTNKETFACVRVCANVEQTLEIDHMKTQLEAN